MVFLPDEARIEWNVETVYQSCPANHVIVLLILHRIYDYQSLFSLYLVLFSRSTY